MLSSFSKQFPSEPLQVLPDHGDEVWYLKFSHNGTRLASGSRDGQIIIWNLTVSVRLTSLHREVNLITFNGSATFT